MKLRVIASFRDINNFALRHEVGDVIEVSDSDRAARLVSGELCEKIDEQPEAPSAEESGEQPEATKSTKGSKASGLKTTKRK